MPDPYLALNFGTLVAVAVSLAGLWALSWWHDRRR